MFYPKTTIIMVLLAGILGYRTLPEPVAEAWILAPSARVFAHTTRLVEHTRWTWLADRARRDDACALIRLGLQQLAPPLPDPFPGEFIARRAARNPALQHYVDPQWLTGIERAPATGLEHIRQGLQAASGACAHIDLPDWIKMATR